ncbi:apolipoprotein L6-like [Rhynchocyon petersi]
MQELQENGDLSPEERTFLEKFPQWKSKLEENIRKLHGLANYADSSHRAFTKSNVLINSMSVASGAMSLLGLALSPVTVGGSLLLTVAGKGLGTAAGATGLVSSICEHFHNKDVQAQASSLAPTIDQEDTEAGEKEAAYVASLGQTVYHSFDVIKDIKKHLSAFKRARAQPHLASAVKRFLATGKVSARRSRQLKKVFKDTPVMMTKNTRLRHIATSGLFLGFDVASLLSDLKELKDGSGSEMAKKLRAKAQELENLLEKLTKLHEILQKGNAEEHGRKRFMLPSSSTCLRGGGP